MKNLFIGVLVLSVLLSGCTEDSTGQAFKSLNEKKVLPPVDSTIQVPSTPQNLTAVSGPNTGQITLDWNHSDENVSDGNISYETYWWTNDMNGTDYNGTIYSNLTYLTHTTPTPSETGLLHYYKVKACNSFGCSSWSNTDSAYPKLGAEANGPYTALEEQGFMVSGNAWYRSTNPSYYWYLSDTNSDVNCYVSSPFNQNTTVYCANTGTITINLRVSAANGTEYDTALITVDSNSSSSGCIPYYDKTTGMWIPCSSE